MCKCWPEWEGERWKGPGLTVHQCVRDAEVRVHTSQESGSWRKERQIFIPVATTFISSLIYKTEPPSVLPM